MFLRNEQSPCKNMIAAVMYIILLTAVENKKVKPITVLELM